MNLGNGWRIQKLVRFDVLGSRVRWWVWVGTERDLRLVSLSTDALLSPSALRRGLARAGVAGCEPPREPAYGDALRKLLADRTDLEVFDYPFKSGCRELTFTLDEREWEWTLETLRTGVNA